MRQLAIPTSQYSSTCSMQLANSKSSIMNSCYQLSLQRLMNVLTIMVGVPIPVTMQQEVIIVNVLLDMFFNLTSMKVGHSFECDVIAIMYMDQKLSQEQIFMTIIVRKQLCMCHIIDMCHIYLFLCFVTNFMISYNCLHVKRMSLGPGQGVVICLGIRT